jgi:hypothetical protein
MCRAGVREGPTPVPTRPTRYEVLLTTLLMN